MPISFHKIITAVANWYVEKNPWWVSLLLGIVYPLCFAPFNHELNILLFPMPLLSMVILVPFFSLARIGTAKRALLHTYLFGVAAYFGQFYWIGNVVAEGLYHMIVLGLIAASLFFGLYFALLGLWFRALHRAFPRLYVILFPSVWILIEALRGWGELAFPWNFLGYSMVSYLPVAQLASFTGPFGLSFLLVFVNILVWELIEAYYWNDNLKQKWLHVVLSLSAICGIAVWGSLRMGGLEPGEETAKIALIQSNMDQAHWGHGSLDTSLNITESLVLQSDRGNPDLVILPESALFCYLVRRQRIARRVVSWYDSLKTPIITGALHWEMNDGGGNDAYKVYNAAFLINASLPEHGMIDLPKYAKIRLLPFSEAMPFKAKIPMLNRVNLGGSDFSSGTEETVFDVGAGIRGGPFLCYEIVFPDFVRRRVAAGANLLVNITNDGWFGKSTGPYQHAAMSRMRCIENGVSMARCANSGISMFVDQVGRVKSSTELYERVVLHDTVSLRVIPTFYTKHGDWPLMVAFGLLLSAVGFWVGRVLLASKSGTTKKSQ